MLVEQQQQRSPRHHRQQLVACPSFLTMCNLVSSFWGGCLSKAFYLLRWICFSLNFISKTWNTSRIRFLLWRPTFLFHCRFIQCLVGKKKNNLWAVFRPCANNDEPMDLSCYFATFLVSFLTTHIHKERMESSFSNDACRKFITNRHHNNIIIFCLTFSLIL